MQFAKNHRITGGFSNLYLIRKSVDGVPTGEAYGMNVMTDYGFSRFFQDKATFPTNLYIGDGADESFNFKTNKTLIRPVSTTAANLVDSALSNNNYFKYPMWYDSISGLISLMCKYIVAYFPDQSNGGITTDVNITEYGIGADVNNLWTHSWLYDLQGDRIRNFTKYPNERLDIEVYFVLTYNESLIQSGWTNGKYCAMTTMNFFLKRRMGYDLDGSTDNIANTYRRNNVKVNRGTSSRTIEMGTNSDATIRNICSDFDITSTTGDGNGYIDGFVHHASGYVCVEQQLQSPPEPLGASGSNGLLITPLWDKSILSKSVSSNQNSGGYDINEGSICELFGYTDKHLTGFTNMNVSTLNMFNYHTGAYDNQAYFTNDSSHQYTETPLQTTCAIPIYYTNTTTGNIIEHWLHINPYPNDPILKFKNGNMTIYATDSYWNRGSWQIIEDPANVPLALQNLHFYITSSNDSSLQPVRQSQEFKIIAENNLVRLERNIGDSTRSGQYATCENYDYGYYVKDNVVYVPEKTRRIVMTGVNSGQTNNTHFCYKNMVVSLTSGTGANSAKYFFTNLADLLDPQGSGQVSTTQYSFYETTGFQGFSSGVTDVLGGIYRTETTNGVIGFQSTQTDEFVTMYIEFENSSGDPTGGHRARTFKFTSRMGCCIADPIRNRIAYFYNNKIYVKEYNIADNDWNTVVGEYDLPSGYAEPVLMFGLRDKLWVNGSSYMVVYDLTSSSGTGTPCSGRISTVTNRSYAYTVETTWVNDVILVYQYTATVVSNGLYIKYDSPTNVYQVPYTSPTSDNKARLYMKLKAIRTNTLALVMGVTYANNSRSGSYRAIADIGKYINPPGIGSNIDISSDYSMYSVNGSDGRDGIYCYGLNYVINELGITPANMSTYVSNIIPIEYAMSHWYTGTTDTITAINYIRHLSGKKWTTVVTNIKDSQYGDSGKPPGSLG